MVLSNNIFWCGVCCNLSLILMSGHVRVRVACSREYLARGDDLEKLYTETTSRLCPGARGLPRYVRGIPLRHATWDCKIVRGIRMRLLQIRKSTKEWLWVHEANIGMVYSPNRMTILHCSFIHLDSCDSLSLNSLQKMAQGSWYIGYCQTFGCHM